MNNNNLLTDIIKAAWQAVYQQEERLWEQLVQQAMLWDDAIYNKAYADNQRRPPVENTNILPLQPIRPGDWAEAEAYNYNLQRAHQALIFLLELCRQLGKRELEGHNLLLGHYLRLRDTLKQLVSRAHDLAIFQQDRAAGVFTIGDDFLSADKIDINKKRDYTPAFLDPYLGGITLPPSNAPTTPQIARITLNPDSNGTAGNNNELWIAIKRDDINVIADGRLDTWFEYEIVTATPLNQTGLTLDFTISFHQATNLNCFRLYFNNLGHPRWPKIKDILVSTDDRNYASLKSDLQWSTPKGQQLLDISPKAVATGGLLHLFFPPRRVKHIRVILYQDSYYLIQSPAGPLCRYAIALREALPLGIIYENVAELISRGFVLPVTVDRVGLEVQAILYPNTSVCNIRHYLSHDGESWREIQPVDGIAPTPEKILSFASQPTRILYYRALLQRLPSDENAAAFRQLREQKDILQFPALPPHTLSLSKVPETQTVTVYLPMAGSYGRDTNWPLGTSDGTGGQTFKVNFYIPEDSTVIVNRTPWHTVNSLANATATDEVCLINPNTGLIQFGDGVNGAIPPGGMKLYLKMPAIRLLFKQSGNFAATLPHPCVPEPEQLRLYRVDPPITVTETSLPYGARVIRLPHANIIPGSLQIHASSTQVLVTEKTYRDGYQELSQPGDYSVDYDKGIIYSYAPTPTNATCSVGYQYRPRIELSYGQWSFRSWQEVEIPAQYFTTQSVTQENLNNQAGAYIVQLANTHLLPQRLSFSTNSNLTREIPFINGKDEFRGVTVLQTTTLPSNVNEYTLPYPPVQGYPITFSDKEVFNRIKDGNTILQPGDYWISFETGTIYTGMAMRGGQVTYYRLQSLVDASSVYSVDYEHGRVYLAQPLANNVTVSYEYCHYEAEYYLTETLPPQTYNIDTVNQQIQITDLPFLHQLQQRYSSDDAIAVQYQHYVTEPLEAGSLHMLTPILLNYKLRVYPHS